MNNCKHHYVYAYESKIYDFDIHYVREAYIKSTLPNLAVGMRVAFYQCKHCAEMLITEKVGK